MNVRRFGWLSVCRPSHVRLCGYKYDEESGKKWKEELVWSIMPSLPLPSFAPSLTLTLSLSFVCSTPIMDDFAFNISFLVHVGRSVCCSRCVLCEDVKRKMDSAT